MVKQMAKKLSNYKKMHIGIKKTPSFTLMESNLSVTNQKKELEP